MVVAVVVILAAIVSVAAFGFMSDINEPAPNVADTAGEFEAGADNQVVRITHIGGDSVPAEEIEIIVRASGSGDDLPLEARLVDLPSDGFGTKIDDTNIQGDDFLDQGTSSPDDQIIVEEDSDIWEAGDTIQFVIASSGNGADFTDPPTYDDNEADTLEVIIVHTPSDAIISESTFTP
jgi:FlaG/FlaF family flagellin (archaellin)